MKTIELTNATYSYDKSHTIPLPDMAINAGERIFVAGSSGSGKTTLLGVLAGTHIATEGLVRLHGQEYKKMSAFKRDRFRADHIGYIFQQFNLITYLSVYDNIALSVKMSKLRMQRLQNPLKSEIDHIAEKLKISELLHKNANEVSVGQAQRVACARALLGAPEIVLADEPTSSLDMQNRHRFLDLLFETMTPSTTLIFVSHDRSLETHFHNTIELDAAGESKK